MEIQYVLNVKEDIIYFQRIVSVLALLQLLQTIVIFNLILENANKILY